VSYFFDYIFTDKDLRLLDECGFKDDEAAENHALLLMKTHKCTVIAYKEIAILDPDIEERS
jgi:hypothetical protein